MTGILRQMDRYGQALRLIPAAMNTGAAALRAGMSIAFQRGAVESILVEFIRMAFIEITVVRSLVGARVIGPIGETVRCFAVILKLGMGRPGEPVRAH